MVYPKDKIDKPAYLDQMRKNSEKAGTDLFLLMAGSLDTNPKKQKSSLKKLLPSIDRASILGCKFLRVFVRATNLKSTVEALKPLADAAAKKKVTIIIEPGSSKLSSSGAFLANVIKQLKHPAVTLMPDFGKLKNNVYKGTEAMMPYASSISAKMHSFNKAGNQPDFDYVRLMKIIKDSKYKGYIAIEWEGRKLKPVAGIKASKALIISSLKANGISL